MTFPLVYFLYAFYAFLVFWGMFSLTALGHILSYGMKGAGSFFAAFGYIAVSAVVLLGVFNYAGTIDWQQNVEFMGGYINLQQ
ncbi:hypothetical protein HGA64_03250 [Candidatus Falkowbacteria bacterium]|nr:hypothetical protein [Candidatus Falkowbacteria bacterium]